MSLALEVIESSRSEWTFPRGYLSPSQVYSMVVCGRCFELKYVENVPEPPSKNFAIGSAVHAAVQRQRERMLDQAELDDEEAVQAASDAYDEHVRKGLESYQALTQPDLWPEGTEVDLAPYKDEALQIAQFATQALRAVDEETQIIAVEQRIFGLGQPMDEEEAALMAEVGIEPILPFKFNARSDLIARTRETQTLVKADLKTAGDRRKPEWWPRLQLTLYSLPERRNGLDVLLRVDQIVKGQRLYLPRMLEPVTPEWEARALQIVMDAAEDISVGRFRCRPSFSCSFHHGMPAILEVVQGLA